MDYQEKILKELTSRYYKSKKDSGQNAIARRTAIQPEKHLYTKYNQNNGSIKEIQAINDAVDQLMSYGFINCQKIAYGDEITHIYMVDDKKEEIEQFLFRKYGHIPKSQKTKEVRQLIQTYERGGPIAQGICRKLQASLDKNKIPAKYEQTADVLKALQLLEWNDRRLYQREFSMLVFGSSKYLEENVRDELCKEIRGFLERPVAEEEMLDEILEEYNVYKESSKIFIKGPVILDYDKRITDLSGLIDGAELSYEQIISADKITIRGQALVTVENLTSFLRCQEDNFVFFYLGGHANRFQIMVLKKIFQDNPDIVYSHFGDIDAGGFFIHNSLCLKSGVPFNMLHMSVQELKNEKYRNCLQPLTENDVSRLRTLAMDERYKETVEYMLCHQIKLEQEIISLDIYERNIRTN